VLIAALVVSSAFVPSGLVTEPTHYMPVLVTGGALTLRLAMETWRKRTLSRPAAPIVLVLVGLYIAWAALATVTSINVPVSLTYDAGVLLVCGLAFWAIPVMLSDRLEQGRLLAAVGVLGVIVAVSVYLVAVVGSINVFGGPLGDIQVGDLTVGGHPTGLLFARSSGAFLAPLEPSVIMVIGVLGLIGWSSTQIGRSLLLARLAIVFVAPAILLTLDRSAWVAAIVGAGAFAAPAIAVRYPVKTAGVTCLFFVGTFLLVQADVVGVNAVGNACTAHCSTAGDETTLRGGTGLSGRENLWRASLLAIEHRPLLGYGLGNNVPAINPFLAGNGLHLNGLTSHSTWFRTAVEIGIPGLCLLLGVFIAAAWVFVRGKRGAKKITNPGHLAFAATVVGLLPAMFFESFLLGGVTFSNLYLAVALGLTVGQLRSAVSSPRVVLASV
jgi:O-antigen ligase